MPKLSGNKGEWSEIYAFLRLLEAGRLYAADGHLEKINTVFYDIIKILRKEKTGNLEFRVNRSDNTVSVVNIDKEKEEILTVLPNSIFKTEADHLYKTIISSTGAAFTSVVTEDFLKSVSVETLKAKSTDKSDIHIEIHDINSGYEAVQGFSVKSRLGSPSTLINAGKTTNFVFEVSGDITDNVMSEFNTCSSKFRDRFDVLKSSGCSLCYIDMENAVFKNNLMLIDGNLPEICALLLIEYYGNGYAHLYDTIESVKRNNPLHYDLSSGHPFYEYKIKKMLTESALGMVPAKMWTGTADATGGYIIVREDGEVLCYHLFNRNEFEEYLLLNTKFETASTSRHDFGRIYKQSAKYYLKLNLQIRFIK